MKSQSQNRMLTSGRLLAVIMMMWILSGKVLASPAQLTYQGRILKTDGTPLEYNNVSFLFQITNPSGACIVYQEQVTGYNMVNSGGVFDVPIGAGTVQYPLGVASILDAFNNSSTFTCGVCTLSGGSYTCADGSSSYAAADGDQRKLRVSFYDGSGWKTISPDSIIRSVPFAGYALSAQKLGNNIASDFLVKAGLPTCGTGTFLSWNGSTLSCAGVSGANGGTVTNVISSNSYLSVVNGATTPTLTLNVGTTVNTVAAGNDSRLTNALQTGATAGGDLTGTLPSPTIAKIQGVSVNTNAPASGEFFKFNGTNWTSSAISTSDVNGLSTTLNSYLTQSAFNSYVASASCTSGQTMYWNSVSGNFQCQSVSVASSQVNFGAQAANTVFAAPIAGGTPSFRVLASSDLPAGTLSGTGTAGYVPYYTSGSTLANSPLYTSSGNVGIGTITPSAKLHVIDEGTGVWQNDNYSSAAGSNPAIIGRKAGGTVASPSAVLSGQPLLFLGGRGWYGSDFSSTSKASITMAASEDWSTTNQGARLTFSTTTNGSTSATERVRIENNGYVGVGTSTPSSSMEVRGTGLTLSNSGVAGIAIFFKPEDQGGTYTNTADQRQLNWMTTAIGTDFGYKYSWRNADGTNRQDAMTFVKDGSVTFAGNVGIGTATPTAKLHVGSAITATANSPLFALGSGAFDGTTSGFFTGNANGTVVGINTASSYTGDFLNFQIGGVSKYKVDNSGNITSSGNVVSSGNTTATGNYTTTGNISTTGTGSISSSGALSANSGTASTSSTTGALVVTGGAGVSGALNVGSNISSSGSITSGGVFKAANGTAAAPSYTYTSDLTTGVFAPSAGTLAISTSGGERLRVTSTGNVGIGTTSPSYPLDVNGIIKSNSAIYGTSFNLSGSGQALNWPGNTEKVQANSTSHYMQLITNGSEAIRIDGSGNVGIGTSTPTANLDVVSINTNNSIQNTRYANGAAQIYGGAVTMRRANGTLAAPTALQNGDTLGGIYGAGYGASNFGANTASVRFNAAENWTDTAQGTSIEFATTPVGASSRSTNMVIAAGGFVGIGTSTPGYKLDINGDANIASSSALRFGGTQVCTSAGCTSSSDSRLKENIKPLENSLEKILSLQGVEYDYKDKSKFGDRHQIGVIAQDVEKVFPEVVVTDQKTTLKSVAYDHLIAPLIESVKALYIRISGVEAVQALQARKIASVEDSKTDKTETNALKEEIKAKDQKIKELEQRLEKIEKAIRSR